MPPELITSDAVVDEVQRVLTICNACRYCEGLCATFQAMTSRRTFVGADMDYLANLCHNCTACYHDCQYAPPHEFAVNVPVALTALRTQSYARYAWPQPLARAFERNGLVVAASVVVALTLVFVGLLCLQSGDVVFGTHIGDGAFYQVISHQVMVAVAGVSFGFSVLALVIGGVRMWRAGDRSKSTLNFAAVRAALRDVATLKYLDGGHGEGCSTTDSAHSNARRWFHQCTMWGFLLCFASTSVATLYDYGFGWIAPYPFVSVPVLLGTVGGVGLLIGCAGLTWVKRSSDPRPQLLRQLGMDYAFLALLFAVALTGLALLVWRETSFMGMLLAVHLGVVLGLFICLPYCKFVHSVYRYVALLRFNAERAD